MTKLKNVIANPARGAAIRWTPPLLGHPQRDYSSGNALFVMTELLITQKQTSADFSADVFQITKDIRKSLFWNYIVLRVRPDIRLWSNRHNRQTKFPQGSCSHYIRNLSYCPLCTSCTRYRYIHNHDCNRYVLCILLRKSCHCLDVIRTCRKRMNRNTRWFHNWSLGKTPRQLYDLV